MPNADISKLYRLRPRMLSSLGIAIARRSWRFYQAVSFTGTTALGGRVFRIPVRNGFGLQLLTNSERDHRYVGLLRSVLDGREGAILDVGVNVGKFWMAAAAAGPDRQYFGFEAHIACSQYARELIAANGMADRAHVFPVGLSDRAGIAMLRAGSDSDVSASTIPEFYAATRFSSERPIVIERGDPIVDGLRSPSVALIKVDVEGAELEVIQGLKQTIKRDRPALILEVAPYAHAEPAVAAFRRRRIADLEGALRRLGYGHFARIVAGNDREPVSTLDPGSTTNIREMDYLCLADDVTLRSGVRRRMRTRLIARASPSARPVER